MQLYIVEPTAKASQVISSLLTELKKNDIPHQRIVGFESAKEVIGNWDKKQMIVINNSDDKVEIPK